MNRTLGILAFLALLGWGIDSSADELHPLAPAPDPFAGWPTFTLAAGAEYAPAPLMMYIVDDVAGSRKLLDQAGGLVAFDWRFAPSFTLGMHLAFLAEKDGWLVDFAGRFTALFTLADRLALTTRLTAGVSHWKTTKSIELTYTGPQLGLSLGLLYFPTTGFGLFFELGGDVSLFSQGSGPEEQWISFPGEAEVIRLVTRAGIVWGIGIPQP